MNMKNGNVYAKVSFVGPHYANTCKSIGSVLSDSNHGRWSRSGYTHLSIGSYVGPSQHRSGFRRLLGGMDCKGLAFEANAVEIADFRRFYGKKKRNPKRSTYSSSPEKRRCLRRPVVGEMPPPPKRRLQSERKFRSSTNFRVHATESPTRWEFVPGAAPSWISSSRPATTRQNPSHMKPT